MELRQYWRIVRRRIWIVVLLVAIVLGASVAFRSPHPALFQASMRFNVGLEPESKGGDYYSYDRYYAWLASEYLIDDLTEVVRSEAFAKAVGQELADEGIAFRAGAITADKKHRVMTVRIVWGDEGELRSVAEATAKVIQEQSGDFVGQLGEKEADIRLIDPPSIVPAPKSLRERLNLPIRLLLALVAGVALTFLLDYLDDSIRNGAELEPMGIEVLGEIPPARRRWFRRGR
ncbi:MAG: hypothetical protein U9R11_04520 [Chloroflexota bacterium]|nr:hypothetical protein [Chloroflexota bacterium]